MEARVSRQPSSDAVAADWCAEHWVPNRMHDLYPAWSKVQSTEPLGGEHNYRSPIAGNVSETHFFTGT